MDRKTLQEHVRELATLPETEAPVVGTGLEGKVAEDSGAVVVCHRAGVVDKVDCQRIIVRVEDDENAEGEAHDAGEKEPNAWGLYDMSGNAWEWCSDFLDRYGEEAEEDPYQAKGEFDLRRAARGGTWATDAGQARACARIGWCTSST